MSFRQVLKTGRQGFNAARAAICIAVVLQATLAACHWPNHERLYVSRPVSSTLTPSDSHTYEIELEADHFASLTVEQLGVDLVVDVAGPEGQLVVRVDRWTSMRGPEPVSFVAPRSGIYEIRIRPVRSDAVGGSYSITLLEARKATAADARLSSGLNQAVARFVAGQELNAKGSETEALDAYRSARALLPADAALIWHATTLTMISEQQFSLNKLTDSLATQEEALSLWRKIAEPDGEAEALYGIAVNLFQRGALVEAAPRASEALEHWVRASNPFGQAIALGLLGRIHDAAGRYQAALNSYDRASELLQPLKEHSWQAYIAHNVGMVRLAIGDSEGALRNYERSLIHARNAHEPVAHVTHHIGEVLLTRGEYDSAARVLSEALEGHKDDLGRATTLLHLARVREAQRNLSEGLRLAEEALRMRHDAEYTLGEAQAYQVIGNMLRKMGRAHDAGVALTTAIDLSRRIGDPKREAAALTDLAQAALDEGRLAVARGLVEQALRITESLRTVVSSLEQRSTLFSTVQDTYDTAIEIVMRQELSSGDGVSAVAALQVKERSLARSLLDALSESRSSLREGLPSDLLAERARLADELAAVEERRLRTPESPGDANGAELNDERELRLKRVEALDARLKAMSPRYAAFVAGGPKTAADIQRTLPFDTLLLEYHLGPSRGFVWVVSKSEVIAVEIAGRDAVEPLVRRLLTLTPNRSRERSAGRPSGPTPIVDEEFNGVLRSLGTLLLEPIVSLLASAKRVVVVGSGSLAHVPFGALPMPGHGPEPLISRYEVVQLPSASVLTVLRARPAAASGAPLGRRVAAFVDPVYGPDDARIGSTPRTGCGPLPETGSGHGRLYYSGDEGEAIRKHVKPTLLDLRSGFDATLDAVQSLDLTRYGVVHFATHAVFDPQYAGMSGLLLTQVDECGRQRSGFLNVSRVMNLRLVDAIVVLSACSTGQGHTIAGEGVVGLVSGFMYAGARSVVASMWEVDDAATAELMSRFYEKLAKGMSTGAALRAAQLELLRSPWSAPVFWGGFVLHGDWT